MTRKLPAKGWSAFGGKIMDNGQWTIKNTQQGFTLIELLVVIGILSMAFGLFLTIFTKVLQGGNKTQIIGSIKQNGQSILEAIDKTIRESDRAVCTSSSGDMVAVIKTGVYTRFRFYPPTASANGYIKQETFSKDDSSTATIGDYEANICTIIDFSNPQIISDTNTQTGVSVTCIPVGGVPNCSIKPIFKRVRTAGFKDELSIKFGVKPGVLAPASSTGQIDDITFQTTISLR